MHGPTGKLLDSLVAGGTFTPELFLSLFENRHTSARALRQKAAEIRQREFGKGIFIRGLIEISNCCRNDCLYCGIRYGNDTVERYRLTDAQILNSCRRGYALGFRTFVLQGGEDEAFHPERISRLIRTIKTAHPDCALTLSLGEYPKEVYAEWKRSGADRYLLRHESANPTHYAFLHGAPRDVRNGRTAAYRQQCLYDLKSLGYQTGAGFMVGTPKQTPAHLAEDMRFLEDLQPHMIGIGPFIPHPHTPLGLYPDTPPETERLELTLFLLSLIRIRFKRVLLPATTALATIRPDGRQLGILHGANVVMPNLTPEAEKGRYEIYRNKKCTGAENAAALDELNRTVSAIGYHIDKGIGNYV